MSFDGSNAQTLMQRCAFAQKGMLADDDHVYFRDADNAIKRMPASGGAPQVLIADTCCGGLTMDNAHIYWGQWGEAGQDNSIRRIPKAGGSVEIVASFPDPANHNVHALAVDSTHVYWTEGKQGNELLNQPGAGSVKRVPKAGGPMQTLADDSAGIDNAGGIAIDNAHAYWTERGSGRVRRAGQDGRRRHRLSRC